MGYIKKLKNNELIGGTDKTTIYPVTSTEAVFEETTNGSESSFKSQKTINKEQQDELDDHEERIQAAEAKDIKSITINGSTKKFEVDSTNNVDLTIYTVDSDPDMPGIADNVRDLRNMVGTSTPVLETSHKTRIENLETTVGTGGTIDSRIATTRAELQEQIDTKQIQLHVGSGLTLDNNGNLSVTLDPAMSKVVTAWPSQADAVKGLIYLKPTSTAGVYEQRVYNDSSYTTLDNVTLSISTDDTLNTGSANPLKNSTVAAQIGYFDHTGNNDNDGSSKVKNITATGFTLPTTAGGAIKIKMKEPNTYAGTQADPVQLQFNNVTSTKKTLLYNHDFVSASNTWEDGEVISVYFDGTYYQASNAQGGGGKAEKIKYDNSQSGLAAKNVQRALDEIHIDTSIITEHYNSENTSVQSNNSNIKIAVQDNGDIVVNNITNTGNAYAVWKLPTTLKDGDIVSISFDYTSTSTSGTNNVPFAENINVYTAPFVTLGNNTSGTVTKKYTKISSYVYLKFYSSTMSSGSTVTISNISITTEQSLKDKVSEIEDSVESIEEEVMVVPVDHYEGSGTSVMSTNSSKLKIETQDDGSIVVTNVATTNQVYARWFLPEVINVGDIVIVKFDYESTSTSGTNNIPLATSTGTWKADFIKPLPNNTSGTIEKTYTKQAEYDCLQFYSSTMSNGAVLTLTNISISVVGTVNDKIDYVNKKVNSVLRVISELEQYDFIAGLLPINYEIRQFDGNIQTVKRPTKFQYSLYMSQNGRGQGAACYGDYLFQMIGGDSSGIYIYSMYEKRHLFSIPLSSNSNWHGDSLSFGNQFYSNSDYFPLLYVTQGTVSPYKVQVYRIQTSDFKTFTATLVQNITMPDKEAGCWYADCALDNDNNYLYWGGDTYPSDNTFTWLKFQTPNWNSGTLTDGVYELVLTSEDVLDSFSANIHTNIQGQTIYHGYLFLTRGYRNVGYNQFIVLNLTTKEIETSINLMPTSIEEIEQPVIWNDTLYLVGNGEGVYKVMFGW